jgi:two-component system sensor histidine kinase GlrK
MKFPRPQSLNGLILVGFCLVALPLLIAIIWALVNLDRLAEQSEQLVVTGISATENNRLLSEQVASLERVARQYLVLRNEDSLVILQQDAARLEQHIEKMAPLAQKANADSSARSILISARRAVRRLSEEELSDTANEEIVAEFAVLRQRVTRLSLTLSDHIELELNRLQDSTRRAQQVSAWQTAALVPGTIILVLFFTLLVAKSIRQIDQAIAQLGKSGFSKPIDVQGPSDLERLGGSWKGYGYAY